MPNHEQVQRWKRDNGDNTHNLNYDLYYTDGIHLNAGMFKNKNNTIDCEELINKEFEGLND